MFDVTERVRTGLYLLDSHNMNSLTSPLLQIVCLLAMSAACLCSEVDEKLIEVVRKCEELYDMSNKKYIDSVWKEKLWGEIGEELKKSRKFQCSFITHVEAGAYLGLARQLPRAVDLRRRFLNCQSY